MWYQWQKLWNHWLTFDWLWRSWTPWFHLMALWEVHHWSFPSITRSNNVFLSFWLIFRLCCLCSIHHMRESHSTIIILTNYSTSLSLFHTSEIMTKSHLTNGSDQISIPTLYSVWMEWAQTPQQSDSTRIYWEFILLTGDHLLQKVGVKQWMFMSATSPEWKATGMFHSEYKVLTTVMTKYVI